MVIHVINHKISSNWAGTYIQAWSSPDALSRCTQPTSGSDDDDLDYLTLDKNDYDDLKHESNVFSKHNLHITDATQDTYWSSGLWNSMIVPILRMSITGTILMIKRREIKAISVIVTRLIQYVRRCIMVSSRGERRTV